MATFQPGDRVTILVAGTITDVFDGDSQTPSYAVCICGNPRRQCVCGDTVPCVSPNQMQRLED